MSANTTDLTEYIDSLHYDYNEHDFDIRFEFWPESDFVSFDKSTHSSNVSETASLASPGSIDPAIYCTKPQPSNVNPQCFSSTTTASTARTTVDGNSSSGEDMYSTVGSPKQRESISASSTAFRSTTRDRQASNRGSHRKSLSEPVKRERNRTAAAKCRAKNKVAEQELQETQRIERARNIHLRAEAERLSNESLMLKNELLSHSDCNHPIINKYLSRTAEQISRGYAVSMRAPTSRGGDSAQKS